MRKKVLLIPSCAEGNGAGHLKRMLEVFSSVSSVLHTEVFLPCSRSGNGFIKMTEGIIPASMLHIGELPPGAEWDFIVVDKRKTEDDEFARWIRLGILIGIDEGGSRRNGFHYLLDTLPVLNGTAVPNTFCTSCLNLPDADHRKDTGYIPPEYGFGRILVSFGGEDHLGLTEKLLVFLVEELKIDPGTLTVVQGPLFGTRTYPPGIRLLDNPDRLKDLLFRYDTVFTSFGLTAYEAAAAGTRVVLFNPSEYHRKLSLKGGFCEVGVVNLNRKRLKRLFSDPRRISVPETGDGEDPGKSISSYILSLEIPEITVCPVCGSSESAGAWRQKARTYFTCSSCGMTYMVSFKKKRDSYRKEYFFSDYEKQYGRTYLDDFDSIRKLSASRLSVIAGIKRKGFLLDAGCAYGPFLVEAREKGFTPFGIELVPEAAEYVRDNLGIPVVCSSFEEAEINEEYDVVTMWYVIEHFKDIDRVLRKVNKIVRDGGLFAFSTPNSSGITGRTGRNHFFENSPEDHYTVWNPLSAGKILSRYGFRIKCIRSTGHHPERFPGVLKAEKGIKRGLLNLVSRTFRLGDTFEVYAIKTRSIFNDS